MAKKTQAQIEFIAVTKQYSEGIKEMNASNKTLQNELRLNATQLKGNADNIDLLKQRQSLLQQESKNTASKIDLLESSLKEAETTLGANSKEYYNLNNALISAKNQQAAIQNELKNTNYKIENQEKGVSNLGKEFKDNESNISSFGDVLKANLTSEVIIDGARKIADGIKKIGSESINSAKNLGIYADDIITTSNQTGLTTTELQELDYAMRFVDVDVDTLTKSIAKNIKQMSANADGYKKLGVKIKDTDGHLRNSTDVFYETIDALGKIKNETERDALSMELFGKSAQDLNPLIKAGSDSIKQYSKEAHDMGLILDEETITKMGSFDDSMQRVDATIGGLKNQLGLALAPAIEGVADDFLIFVQNTDFTPLTNGITLLSDGAISFFVFLGDNIGVIETLAIGIVAGATAFGTATIAVGIYNGVMDIMALSTGAATVATTGLGTAFTFLTGPIGIITIAVGGAVAAGVALYKNWDTVCAWAGKLKNNVLGSWNGIKTGITDKINGAKDAVGKAINYIKGFFNFKFIWPKLSMPHFSVKPEGWKIGDLLKGKIPSLGIKWYAEGGFFKGPTVLSGLGEKSNEYALPLNDRTLNPLASLLADKLNNLHDTVYQDLYADIYVSVGDDLIIDKISKKIAIKARRERYS